jgi:TP901 family phage tail tape measure protein
MAAADTARLIAELTLKDKLSAGVTTAIRSVDKLDKRLSKVGTIAGQGFSNAARNIERAAVGIGVAMGGAIVGAVKVAADFESQLNTINTIARATPEALGDIGDQIRQIARDTGTPLEELTQGYYDLLSAGIKTADAQNVLTNANKLAIGGLATAAEGVDLLTTAINVYGGDASKAGQFTDEFAKAIERGKVTAAELAASYAQSAPLAKSLNIENAELAAGYARLTAAGTPAAEASTQMASAMTALLKKTPALEKLEKQTGKNYAALAGSNGLTFAFEQARNDANKYGVELIDLIGRKEALLYILQTTGPNFAAYNADLAAMGDSAGTAAGQMSERQQGLNFQLSRLKALAKDAGISIGSALIPKLVPLVEKFNAFINNNQAGIKQFGTDLANAFQGAAEWIGKLDFRQIGDSLKVAGIFAKTLIQSFLAAPAWLQTAVITGWGLNKLTGGAISGIVGELGKGLIKGVLGMNAGVVNINAATVNGLGGTGGAAAAAGKGGLGLVSKVFLVGEAIGLAALVFEVKNGISAGNTEFAKTLAQTNAEWLSQNPSMKALENGLAAVEAGMQDIFRTDPQGLVSGESLKELQGIRAAILQQIANQKKGVVGPEMFGPRAPAKSGGLSPTERDERLTAILERAAKAGRTPKDPLAAAQATLSRNLIREAQAQKAAIDAVKAQEGRTTAGVLLTAAAVQNMDRKPPTTNVFTTVTVTAANVKKSVVIQRRAGPQEF